MVFDIELNKKKYRVNSNEFNKITHNEYTNLCIRDNLGYCERIISLMTELSKSSLIDQCVFYNTMYGGFIPIGCASTFNQITLENTPIPHIENIKYNIQEHAIANISIEPASHDTSSQFIVFSDKYEYVNSALVNKYCPIIVSTLSIKLAKHPQYTHIYELSNSNLFVYIPDKHYSTFYAHFHYYIQNNEDDGLPKLAYDNLIHLCIMVKNGGEQFEDMLLKNMNIIDRWTILDTGSTDNTINTINKVLVGKKRGDLYQEPFINFRDSRNRLLDLASTPCKYIIMLDDSYIVQGDLRKFLAEVRGDQYANSFTLMIHSDDTKYGSNRIIKSISQLRYMYKIHEVISDKNNINIVIPESSAIIFDGRFDYLEKRTMLRKQLDLKLLFEEVEDDPMNPRTYYYLAQTYNLLEDYENSYKYFLKRAEFTNSGFIQERVDAIFEAARTANFKLSKSWTECEELYNKAYQLDPSRPDSLYFIGIHYYLENNVSKAYEYFKKGFQIGFPQHCQYSLKPTLSYIFLPKFLTRVCYQMEDYILGEAAAELFLIKNAESADDYQEMVSWYNIFKKLNMYEGPKVAVVPEKPIFCFVADGGFNKWSGKNILTTGVGGSETYIIEMARWIQHTGNFQTYVFCNCDEEEVFEGTIYKPLQEYYKFINSNYVQYCIVSRFSEYLPVTFKGFSENVYLVVHDLTPIGVVIPLDKKLKNVFCLTEWHVEYFTNIFSQLKNITIPFYYGFNGLKNELKNNVVNNKLEIKKQEYSFIYSSFPNRGLLQLLQMWPKIYGKKSGATLHIYSDVNNKWSNDVEPEKMNQIKLLLENYSKKKNGLGIHYHGWVKKSILLEAWQTADIWFYPCTFMETFCLTALEAAHSKTFVITNDLAALQNTVGDRGAIIKGDPMTDLWQEEALKTVFFYLNPDNISNKNELIERNFAWAKNLTWENQANKLLNEIILPNTKFEYKGMYNWTNDIEKEPFLNTIKYFNDNYDKVKNGEKIKVLEIGVYTGISLINIINNIPNSIGVGVDMWASYNENNLLENMDNLEIEKSFYKNINTSGLDGRITGIKMDSTTALLNYIRKNETFDFIYVDGSHLLLDCYSDLVLSWEILENGGILAIDDYYYKMETVLDSPFAAVNHFFKRYTNKYKLLHKGCRVFIQKSTL